MWWEWEPEPKVPWWGWLLIGMVAGLAAGILIIPVLAFIEFLIERPGS